MDLISVGVLQAVFDANVHQTLVLISGGRVLATNLSRLCRVVCSEQEHEHEQEKTEQMMMTRIEQDLLARATCLSQEGAPGDDFELSYDSCVLIGRVQLYRDARTTHDVIIITLERKNSRRPWDMVIDEKQLSHVLMKSWPVSLITAEWLEREQDIFFHVVNETGARMLGFQAAQQVIGKRASQLGWSMCELQEWAKELKKTREGQCCIIERETILPQDGSRHIRRCVGVCYWDPIKGENLRFLHTVEDVTDLRTSMQQLQSWKLLFDKAPLGMGIARLIDDDQDMIFETVNPLVAQMLEKLAGERPPRGYRGSMLPNKETQDAFRDQAIQCRNKGTSINLEYSSENPLSSQIEHWKVHYVPLGENRVGWIAQNITVQKELELMLRKEGEKLERLVKERTADLEAALQVKNRFLAVVSHELRTPIAGILGSMELLAENESKSLNEEQTALLGIARTCGAQLSTVIDDILDFTKLQQKQSIVIKEDEFNLRELFEELMEISSFSLHGKNIELLLDHTTEETPERIITDVNRLRQIMLNLLTNAIKFTERGEVHVSVHSSMIEASKSQLMISVRDTGIGIPPSAWEKIFQPFSQVDSSVARRFGGSGLGLSISKHLAQLMGGDLTFQSVVNVGSTFTIRLPVKVTSLVERPAKSLPRREDLVMRVVLIEPQASLRELLRAHLYDMLTTGENIFTFENVGQAAASSSWSERGGGGCLMNSTTRKRSASDLVQDDTMLVVLIMDQKLASEADVALSQRFQALIVYGYPKDESILSTKTGMRHLLFMKKPIRAVNLRANLLAVMGMSTAEHASTNKCKMTSQPNRSSRQLKILVAEDNHSNQVILGKYLDGLGYRDVKMVENGLEAVTEATKTFYDVILMDIMMPTMDGLEASERINQLPSTRRPFIVAVTASAFEGDKQRCLAAGMQAVLTKPVDRKKLESLLNERHQ